MICIFSTVIKAQKSESATRLRNKERGKSERITHRTANRLDFIGDKGDCLERRESSLTFVRAFHQDPANFADLSTSPSM
jgi:hypothetical protein